MFRDGIIKRKKLLKSSVKVHTDSGEKPMTFYIIMPNLLRNLS